MNILLRIGNDLYNEHKNSASAIMQSNPTFVNKKWALNIKNTILTDFSV